MRSQRGPRSLGLALLLALASRCPAGVAPADLRPLLGPIAAKHPEVPALFGAIVDHGRLTFLGAVGFRKAGSFVPVSPDDPVHLGSDTKAMTAVLIGQLVESRQLAWTDSLGQLLPDVKPSMNPAMVGVTVANLLQHTAGLPHDLDWGRLNRSGRPLDQQRLAAVRLATALTPASPPGTRYAYSNIDYVLLGAIVERVTGRPWEQVIVDRLFRPLDMRSAGFGPPGPLGTTDVPWGHRTVDGRPEPVQGDNPPVMAPAGEVHCSMADWARFAALFCRQPNDGLPNLLGGPTLAALTRPAVGGTYAGGWIVARRGGEPALTHAGSNTMWYCLTWVFPARGFAVLAAANSGSDDAAAACRDTCDALIRRQAGR